MVKCAECGFLALRDKKTGLLVEVIDDYRVSGRVPEGVTAYKEYHNYPICFAMAYDLMPEVEQAAKKQFKDKSNDWGSYVLEVINSERRCPPNREVLGFTKYQQGFTPKEHREMLDRERLLQWQEEREKSDRSFRIQESGANRRYRIAELILVAFTIGAILFTAFWGRDTEPTINIITPDSPEVTIEQKP